MTSPKRLYRVKNDSRWLGVCSGLGDYFRIDPTIIRLLWITATLMTGLIPGIVAYLLAWVIVPEEPTTNPYAEGTRAS